MKKCEKCKSTLPDDGRYGLMSDGWIILCPSCWELIMAIIRMAQK